MALPYHLATTGLRFDRQVAVPVTFGEVRLDCGYRADLVVEGVVLVELKSVTLLKPIHSAQVMTYMKLAKLRHGVLINFNVMLLKYGVRTFVNAGAPRPDHPAGG